MDDTDGVLCNEVGVVVLFRFGLEELPQLVVVHGSKSSGLEYQEWLISIGFAGMFLSAFLAGTIVPFNSEIIFMALLAAGLDGFWLLAVATFGNSVGGATTYYLGRAAGRKKAVEELTGRRGRALDIVRRWGSVLAVVGWLPVWGNVFLFALGWLGNRAIPVLVLMTVGKAARYVVLLALA